MERMTAKQLREKYAEVVGEPARSGNNRRRGKWTGGTPILGYDVDRSGPRPKLAVNAAEAVRVREIFALYLKHGSLLPVVEELTSRGWLNKAWRTKAGEHRGGRPFDKCSLYALLTNPVYVGKVRHKKELYAGEHEPIVDADVFDKVQTQLQRNGRSGGVESRNRYGALLKRLLYCKDCGKAMVHHFTGRKGKRYRYYTCLTAIKSGRKSCPGKSLPAAEIERVVLDRVRCIARDARLRAEVVRQARALAEGDLSELRMERRGLERDLTRYHAEMQKLAARSSGNGHRTARLADLQEQVARAECRLAEVRLAIAERERDQLDEREIAAAFGDFDTVWGSLSPREQAETLSLLVARVEYDAANSQVTVSFHDSGIKTLAATQGDDT